MFKLPSINVKTAFCIVEILLGKNGLFGAVAALHAVTALDTDLKDVETFKNEVFGIRMKFPKIQIMILNSSKTMTTSTRERRLALYNCRQESAIVVAL